MDNTTVRGQDPTSVVSLYKAGAVFKCLVITVKGTGGWKGGKKGRVREGRGIDK